MFGEGNKRTPQCQAVCYAAHVARAGGIHNLIQIDIPVWLVGDCVRRIIHRQHSGRKDKPQIMCCVVSAALFAVCIHHTLPQTICICLVHVTCVCWWVPTLSLWEWCSLCGFVIVCTHFMCAMNEILSIKCDFTTSQQSQPLTVGIITVSLSDACIYYANPLCFEQDHGYIKNGS